MWNIFPLNLAEILYKSVDIFESLGCGWRSREKYLGGARSWWRGHFFLCGNIAFNLKYTDTAIPHLKHLNFGLRLYSMYNFYYDFTSLTRSERISISILCLLVVDDIDHVYQNALLFTWLTLHPKIKKFFSMINCFKLCPSSSNPPLTPISFFV